MSKYIEYLRKAYLSYVGVCLSLGLFACRKEEAIIPSNLNRVSAPYPHTQKYKGVYILNEGTMGRNIASLDYFDYTQGIYHRNLFAERNPYIARELGDVGNDLKLYRGELWAVINTSNLIEVMQAETAQHIAQISIANARYLAFEGDFAYVSSYAGPVGLDPNARVGKVVKINIKTKQIVDECLVGYQPEEMAIVGHKLYVANSGGYRRPHYDSRMSVIDLATFRLDKHIPIAINLSRIKADKYGRLWIVSRGNHKDIPSNLYVFDTKTEQLVGGSRGLEIACSDVALEGDVLYLYGSNSITVGQGAIPHFMSIDLRSLQVVNTQLLRGGERGIRHPYGIAINSEQSEILIADAGDYVSPGRVLCFGLDGRERWRAMAGVIPSSFVFTPFTLKVPQRGETDRDLYHEGQRPYAHRVLDYRPAPGQFVNKMPEYQEGDTPERMRQKVEKALARPSRRDKGELITLGAWGGYVVVAFDHRVENRAGLCDLRILGNTFEGGSEPGVIYVAQDLNGNAYPDHNEWRRIQGSAERLEREPFYPKLLAQGSDLTFYPNYSIRYIRPRTQPQVRENETLPYIPWLDNQGAKGYIYRNSYHQQSYYPLWLDDRELRFEGVRLPTNVLRSKGQDLSQDVYVGYTFSYGYADNAPNQSNASAIDIDWAIDAEGNPARLTGIDFVKIQTGVLSDNGRLGESSTEVAGIVDLHLIGEYVKSPI
ncbi:MAG: hypothetical protein Q4A64_01920 [Porphyromonadaceae bacterium]|nr:hypothetical protein [Porphyromonadaceae bacterium]